MADATRPERRGQQQQGQQEHAPIALEPQLPGQEVAEAVHVRIRGVGPASEVVQVLRVVQHRQRRLPDQHQHQHRIADELVVAQDLQHQGHTAHQHIQHRAKRQRLEIQERLDRGVATAKLQRDRGQRPGELEAGDHGQQGDELAEQGNPVRHRHGIGDAVGVVAAFFPHQFAGIEQHHDDQQKAVAVLQRLQHQ